MDQRPLQLACLLAAHQRDLEASTLPDILGDGVLYRRNAVYRAIRDEALALGCQFTPDDEHGYFAWPLVSLIRVLSSRRIPYRKSWAAFAALEQSRPSFFTTRHAELVEPQVNVVMHEAAHCIADHLWQKLAPRCAGLSLEHRTVLRYTFGEAFANASELAAMAHTASAEERWLLSFNSYWSHLPRFPGAWKLLARELTPAATARWLMLCFLAANLGRTSFSPKLRQDLLALSGIAAASLRTPRVAAALDFLASEAMNLNVDFRTNTAELFYASLGLSTDIKALTAFDFVGVLAADAAMGEYRERCAEILSRPGPPRQGDDAPHSSLPRTLPTPKDGPNQADASC